MKLGIIGGSGLYQLEGLTGIKEEKVHTPYGEPSDSYICGKIAERELCFLPRHGAGHRLLPSELNHRANIFGFKALGVERIISVSAVGSLNENLRPRDVALPDQYFDRTKRSADHTFFGQGVVAHIGFGEPVCPDLRKILLEVSEKVITADDQPEKVKVVDGGVYVNMEGPAFSTKAESNMYRQMGFDVIGMTSLAEAKLAREAEICYQPLAMVTDYDCWKESEEAVSVEMVVENLKANSSLAKRIIRQLIPELSSERKCDCQDALGSALMTPPEAISEESKSRLGPILEKYV
ncbi:MAG: S-methyl-5'-thioadenosine phosphorylase [Verrucomicrobiota bacterium]